jgi:hypothetical protein
MKHVVASLTIGACLLLSSGGVAFATNAHMGTTGQTGTTGSTATGGPTPGVASCGAAGTTMGSTQASPPGQVDSLNTNSPFPTLGNPMPSKAYAGGGAGNSAANNVHANSQYDNACFQHQVP